MPSTSPALLVRSAGQAFERGTVERRDVGPHDVLIDIAYAGICHSDIHQAREEWGAAIFPMVPGHEIAGTVRGGRLGSHLLCGGRPRGGRLLRRLLPRMRELPRRRRAVLPEGQRRHVQRPYYDGTAHDGRRPTAATAPRSSSTRSTSCASRTACRSTPPRRCSAPASRPIRRCATGMPGRARGSPSSAWAASVTWASRSRTRWAPT